MATVHPSLNGQGYTKNPLVIADEIFAESIYSRESQSDIYNGNIISLDSMVKQWSDDPDQLCAEMRDRYTELFERHFDDVRVTAVPELPDGVDTFNVVLKIRYTRLGASYDFSRIIENYNGVVKAVLEVINNG